MSWDEMTGSLDFGSLRKCYAAAALKPEDVVHAIYRRIEARGATVLCGHDNAQWATLRKGADAYE